MNIVITGASSGVGYEAVLNLIATTSHRVVALARSADKLSNLAAAALAVNPDCQLFTYTFDIVHGDYDNELLPFITERCGSVDVLINNAGTLINKPFLQLTQLDFAAMLQSNFLGHVKMIQNLLPLMKAGSHVLNIGSMGGYTGSEKFAGLTPTLPVKLPCTPLPNALPLNLPKAT